MPSETSRQISCRTLLRDEGAGGRPFVEGGLIQDHDLGVGQEWTAGLGEPGVEERRRAAPLEQEGACKREPIRAAMSDGRGRRGPEVRPETRGPFGAEA